MRSIIIYLFVLSPLPAILLRPHVGIMVWAWVSYMNPHKLSFGSAFEFPFLDVIAVATLAGWLFSREPKLPPNHPIVWLLLIYFLFVSLTTFIGVDTDMSFDKWLLFTKVILFTFVTLILINNKVRLNAFLGIITISIAYFGVKGGLFTLLKGGVGIVWGPPGGFFGDNNHLALALVMTIPLLRYFNLHAPHKYVRWVALPATGFVLLSVFGSQSRGALLALVAMLVFFVILSNRRAIGLAMIAVAAVVGFLFMPQSWSDRMDTIGNFEEDKSALGRVEMWRFGKDVADDYPLGGGFDVFYNRDLRARYLGSSEAGRASHSIYFEVLGEHGYGGLFLFFLVGSTAFFVARRTQKLARGDPELLWAVDLSAMCQISLGAFAFAGAFLNMSTFDLYWHIISIILITHEITRRKLSDELSSAPETDLPKAGETGPATQRGMTA